MKIVVKIDQNIFKIIANLTSSRNVVTKSFKMRILVRIEQYIIMLILPKILTDILFN